MKDTQKTSSQYATSIAIVGMAGRFPGARDVDQFWRNLCGGVESMHTYTDEELAKIGADPSEVQKPNYVRTRGFLENTEYFDAKFFGFSPREAEVMDPQQRVFLECAWESLENAGYAPSKIPNTGVFASASMNTYLRNLYMNPEVMRGTDYIQLMTGNDKDYLASRVSYKLNLTGPSFTVQSACSSSLIAVHLACRALITHECDLALAGGVSVRLPVQGGYLYHEGGVWSPDGHIRAFDANAKGTVFCNGVAAVTLKRMTDALRDGDTIHAVIKSSAVNNDGAQKVGYTAPGTESQANVVRTALALAGVSSDRIGFIEAHGTGTALGDPIEIAALTKAFGVNPKRKEKCAIGSVKTNIGHLDVASGVASLIKTAFALKHGLIPPSLNFETPNPEAKLESSPFEVVTQLREWKSEESLRLAGVHSLGFGGTNVHLVLEEAPKPVEKTSDGPYLLPVSAKTMPALEAYTRNLAEHLQTGSHQSLADVAYTLQAGREAFPFRKAFVAQDHAQALHILREAADQAASADRKETRKRSVVFMFPGQGAQYPGMGEGLYRENEVFRTSVDQCAALLEQSHSLDIRSLLYDPAGSAGSTETRIHALAQTSVAQVALFVTEYALAQVWMSWGVSPDAMIGHSIGEYVAACLAGVFTLGDALALVVKRGALMQSTAEGCMLAAVASPAEVERLATGSLSVAALNGPLAGVVSGPVKEIDALESILRARGTVHRRLTTSHAFHSALMDPILDPFRQALQQVKFHKPGKPYISNLTGGWITSEMATDPESWVKHLRGTVRFGDGISLLRNSADRVFIEVGPGSALSSFAKQYGHAVAVPTLPRTKETAQESRMLLESLGKVWTSGADVRWPVDGPAKGFRRVPLPAYPFERQKYFVEAAPAAAGPVDRAARQQDLTDWFYRPSWKQSIALEAQLTQLKNATWTIFTSGGSLEAAFAERLRAGGANVYEVIAATGAGFTRESSRQYRIDPLQPAHYQRLIGSLAQAESYHFVSFWPLVETVFGGKDGGKHALYSLTFLVQAIGEKDLGGAQKLTLVCDGLASITDDDRLCREKALLTGACLSIRHEYPSLDCELVDIGSSGVGIVDRLLLDCSQPSEAPLAAYRMGKKWIRCYERFPLDAARGASPVRDGSVVLITGGLGGLGLVLAEHLATTAHARLVLVGRSAPPARQEWDKLLRNPATKATVRQQILVLQSLEARGTQVLTYATDVCDQLAMRGVVTAAEAKLGPITGVIHAAGVAGGGILQFKPQAEIAQTLSAKVDGTLVLEEIFAQAELDFFVLCSSMAAIRGSFGQVPYAAANAFLDAFSIANHLRPETPAYSIGWDTWRDVGMAQNASLTSDLEHQRARRLEMAMTNTEGIEVFQRILSAGAHRMHVLVSTQDVNFAAQRKAGAPVQQMQARETTLPVHDRPDLETAFVAPRTELETRIAEVWRAILGIKEIGVRDDFWELGGHSLLATQIVSRLRESTGAELPLRILFESPTIEQIAETVNQLQATPIAGDRQAPPPLVRAQRDGSAPLSYAQEGLWLLHQLDPQSSAYNIPFALRLTGELNTAALQKSLSNIFARHEILRTRFVTIDGQPRQQLSEHGMPFHMVDLSATENAGMRNDEARRLATIEARLPFDLSVGPLMRVQLQRLTNDEHSLLITLHHIAADGWSIDLLVNELLAGYAAELEPNQQHPALPALPIDYADFAIWQREWMQGEALEQGLRYWEQQLSGLTPLDLPTDYPRSAVFEHRLGAIRFALAQDKSDALKQMARREGVSLFTLIMAAFQCLLGWYSAQSDIGVGADFATRVPQETESLIGLFVNQMVIRARLNESHLFSDLVQQVRATLLDAQAYQDVPFQKIVERLAPGRRVNSSPLFDVKLSVLSESSHSLHAAASTRAVQGLVANNQAAVNQHAKFDLLLTTWEYQQQLLGLFEYRAELFAEGTISLLSAALQHILSTITEDPAVDVATLYRSLDDLRERLVRRKTTGSLSSARRKSSSLQAVTGVSAS